MTMEGVKVFVSLRVGGRQGQQTLMEVGAGGEQPK